MDRAGPGKAMRVTVVGAGVAGLVTAVALAESGVTVEVIERGAALGAGSCSWSAGGMLAPWCERESADAAVSALGEASLDWWSQRHRGTVRRGSLVVAPPRDIGELSRFARRTERFEWLGAEAIAALEPDLAGRFHKALYFPDEGHLEPRLALASLAERLIARGVPVRFGVDALALPPAADWIVDCRGFAARDALFDLRGVRGEMLVVRSREIALRRPVRMLHPRIPLYIVPRAGGGFMVGATMIESAERGRITARSMIELLNGAYALHPAFGEAEIVEVGADVRPAFPDNLPRLLRQGRTIFLNGLFRHGFLLAPAFAREVTEVVLGRSTLPELKHASHPERQTA